MALTLAVPAFATPSPPAWLHTTDVDEAHVAVRQWLSPIVDVGVASRPPKLSPDTVTLHPAVEAPLSSLSKLTTGASSRGKLALEDRSAKNQKLLVMGADRRS
jgi:hypothetical protein